LLFKNRWFVPKQARREREQIYNLWLVRTTLSHSFGHRPHEQVELVPTRSSQRIRNESEDDSGLRPYFPQEVSLGM